MIFNYWDAVFKHQTQQFCSIDRMLSDFGLAADTASPFVLVGLGGSNLARNPYSCCFPFTGVNYKVKVIYDVYISVKQEFENKKKTG